MSNHSDQTKTTKYASQPHFGNPFRPPVSTILDTEK